MFILEPRLFLSKEHILNLLSPSPQQSCRPDQRPGGVVVLQRGYSLFFPGCRDSLPGPCPGRPCPCGG